MNSCSRKKRALALQASGALEPKEQMALRAHLQSCPACRAYLSELTRLTDVLGASQPGPIADLPPGFHERVTRRLRATGKTPIDRLIALLPARPVWRIAIPSGAAALLLVLILLRRHESTTPVPTNQPADSPNKTAMLAERDLVPTLSNYRVLANRSFDQLDDVLDRQALKSFSSTPAVRELLIASRSLE